MKRVEFPPFSLCPEPVRLSISNSYHGAGVASLTTRPPIWHLPNKKIGGDVSRPVMDGIRSLFLHVCRFLKVLVPRVRGGHLPTYASFWLLRRDCLVRCCRAGDRARLARAKNLHTLVAARKITLYLWWREKLSQCLELRIAVEYLL